MLKVYHIKSFSNTLLFFIPVQKVQIKQNEKSCLIWITFGVKFDSFVGQKD